MEQIDLTLIQDLANEALEQYKAMVLGGGHSATGRLVKDSKVIVLYENDSIKITFDLPEEWEYLENGTKPHMPPVQNILQWVKVKRILPRPMRNGKLPTDKGLAWMIAKKIKKYGTMGTGYLRESLQRTDLLNKAAEAAAEAVAKAGLDEVLEIIYSKS